MSSILTGSIYLTLVPVAQRIRHLTTNQGIVGSNPTGDAFLVCFIKKNKNIENGTKRLKSRSSTFSIKNISDCGGVRTHASEENSALSCRLRPLGHAIYVLQIKHSDNKCITKSYRRTFDNTHVSLRHVCQLPWSSWL